MRYVLSPAARIMWSSQRDPADEQAVIARMEMRKKQKTQRKDRKSAASQSRMKTIANLAAEEKVSKKRKKGDGECSRLRRTCGKANDTQMTMALGETTRTGQSTAKW